MRSPVTLRANRMKGMGEREEHVEGQSPHRVRRVERLGHGNERDGPSIEYLCELGEIYQRAAEPIDL
jgi:hypothetical protein